MSGLIKKEQERGKKEEEVEEEKRGGAVSVCSDSKYFGVREWAI